jgi:hypothetical protein
MGDPRVRVRTARGTGTGERDLARGRGDGRVIGGSVDGAGRADSEHAWRSLGRV